MMSSDSMPPAHLGKKNKMAPLPHVNLSKQGMKVEEVPGLVSLIGNTPLIPLKKLHPTGNLFAKLEWYNPGQSAKDRPAWNIIRHALQSGALTKDKVLLDASSGNTAIAYAMLGAAMGISVSLCLPANVTSEKIKILQAYGAELHLTDPLLSSDGSILRARELVKDNPGKYFYGDQYSNPHNWQAHFEATGPELMEQSGGEIAQFVATLGTAGTFTGVGRYLKQEKPSVVLTEVQPDSPFHGLEGMKHMGTAMVPDFYDANLADNHLTIRTEDVYQAVADLATKEGLLTGISSGAAFLAAKALATKHPQQMVVTVFPDNGIKYLGERFWEDLLPQHSHS